MDRRVFAPCAFLAIGIAACTTSRPASSRPASMAIASPNASAAQPVTITLLGTNDLHGHVETLPFLASYVRAVRAARAQDHGGVVLVDAGDLFQGTIASNAFEGAPVIAAYNAIGYDAIAIGNHDFDYGARDDASGPPADPRGALLARASEAHFPFLAANILDRETHAPVRWPHVTPHAMLTVSGVRIGLVGVATAATLSTTLAANVRDLAMASPRDVLVSEAAALRREGAVLVIAVAHAGGRCRDLEHAEDAASCDREQEIVQIAEALPVGTVDAIVAGHTHQGMANVVNGVPVIESYALGRAFGRVDFRVDARAQRVIERRVQPPRDLCMRRPTAEHPCEPGTYEGVSIAPASDVAALIAPALEHARTVGARPLGVNAATTIRTQYDRESPLGNLLADLLREATPGADVAVLNGGGVRADLPAGPLTYGHVYEVMPFDNRVAVVEMRASALRDLITENLTHAAGIVQISGVRATARCDHSHLVVNLTREGNAPLGDNTLLRVATSDFLVAGGDGYFAGRITRDVSDDQPLMLRDVFAAQLSTRTNGIRADDPRTFDSTQPRLMFEGTRPLVCH